MAKSTTVGAANGSETVVEIPKIDVRRIEIKIVGDSSLICHQWSDKARKEMLDKQMKKAKSAKEAKEPWMDFCRSLYWMTEMPVKPTEKDVAAATFGFPSVAFKSAAVSACRDAEGLKMTEARGRFHIIGDMVKIHGVPMLREDMVRVGMGTADIRFRGEFKEWSVVLPIVFNQRAASVEQIVNLFNIAGFGVGVGEWRPEKNGSYGRFHVGN